MIEPVTGSGPKLTVGDILYVIFRHKWKIALVSALGVVGALALPLVKPIQFESEAKLYITSVVEYQAPTQTGENAPSSTILGGGVINTELEILKSHDLAQQVADDIGAEKLLALAGGGTNRLKAGWLISSRLAAEVVQNASVIRLAFKHPDPDLAQTVLSRLITFYFTKHTEIHNPGAVGDLLTKETEKLRDQLQQSRNELETAKKALNLGGPVAESIKASAERIAVVQQELLEAEVELASREAQVGVLKRLLPGGPMVSTNELATTNSAYLVEMAAVPAEKIAQYKRVCSELEANKKTEQERLSVYAPGSAMLKGVRSQIEASEKLKRQLEREYPGLLATAMSGLETKTGAGAAPGSPPTDIISAMAGTAAFKSKVEKLTAEFQKLTGDAKALREAEDRIRELETAKDRDELFYNRMLQGLLQIERDKRVSAERVTIRDVQKPSPAVPATSKLQKLRLAVLLGGIGGGIALAFLIELYLDPSLKRPVDIETRLRMPLFVSIPRFGANGKRKTLPRGKRLAALPDHAGRDLEVVGASAEVNEPAPQRRAVQTLELAPWDPLHEVRPFCEGLRDRLITHFELRNLTHKPKMVAVTSCAEGSGVSTIAAGLAASLSETGDGNVLLVELNPQSGSVRQFFQGGLACGLEEVLAVDKRDNALIQDRLYVASEATNRDRLPSVLPKRFRDLVPRLRASDYDYIIFDMPPVSQVSMTPRLAKFMDTVLMVVESEKTNREAAQRANALLALSKADVAVVLNKTQQYVPKGLQQET